MAKMNVSLQQSLHKKLLTLLSCAFVVISLSILFFVEALNRAFAEKELALKHRVVEQTFNYYLTRAEDEMSLISQDLSLNDYDIGNELDLIFSHHEELIFGELDFFYVEWSDGEYVVDPRARLFTEVDFQSLIQTGLLNRWVAIYTQDNATFLMNKKKIVSGQRNLGFLYGFISLNDNLTLTSLLLDSAKINAVRIFDNSQNKVLIEAFRSGENLLNSALLSSLPLATFVDSSLQLEISQKSILTFGVAVKALFYVMVAGIALVLFYFLFVYQVRMSLFAPLRKMSLHGNDTPSQFSEIELIQQKRNLEKSTLIAKDHRFKLLTESVDSAIIFCNEVTEIQMINSEAIALFPDSVKARTIFDFMPIFCHQPIQEALKGELGVTFDMTMKSMNRIYKWHAYPFINDNVYQGVLLVGRDTTQESSLIWQLDQLKPLSTANQKKADIDSVLNELLYLSEQSHFTSASQLQGWMKLLTSILGSVGRPDNSSSLLPLGEFLSKESAYITKSMEGDRNRVFIECSLEDSMKIIEVNSDLKSLIHVLMMMVNSNDMGQPKFTIRLHEQVLDFVVRHDTTLRPIYDWVINAVLARAKGIQKVLPNKTLQLQLFVQEEAPKVNWQAISPDFIVAWVVNDYSYAESMDKVLGQLGVTVERYASTDSFLTQFNQVSHFDAIIIGCDKAFDTQVDITESLQSKYSRTALPLIWLNSFEPMDLSADVIPLLGCPFTYNVYCALQIAAEREAVLTANARLGQDAYWVLVGGSRVAKAIWYSALESKNITVYWWKDLSSYYAVLSQHPEACVVLLEAQSEAVLNVVHIEFPKASIFSVQRWDNMPNYVVHYNIKSPYSHDQINMFANYVTQFNE